MDAVAAARRLGISGLGAMLTPAEPLIRWYASRWPDVVFAGPTDRRAIALTLDDGPDELITPGVLELLGEYAARATFFVLGSRSAGRRALLERMVGEGHELANHMWSDRRAWTLSRAELERELLSTHRVLEPVGGVRYFRPGSGLLSPSVIDVTERHGYQCVLGSVYAFDAQVSVPAVTVAGLLQRIKPGSIVIVHEGPGRHGVLQVLRRLLPVLAARGYSTGTVSELIARPP